jgi:hypothetical protein
LTRAPFDIVVYLAEGEGVSVAVQSSPGLFGKAKAHQPGRLINPLEVGAEGEKNENRDLWVDASFHYWEPGVKGFDEVTKTGGMVRCRRTVENLSKGGAPIPLRDIGLTTLYLVFEKDLEKGAATPQRTWLKLNFTQPQGEAAAGLDAARRRAMEATAISDLRTLISSELGYSLHNEGYFDELKCLAASAACLRGYTGAPLLADAMEFVGEKNGYRRTFHAGPKADRRGKEAKTSPSSLQSFAITAVPLTPRETDDRSFCADDTGRVCSSAGEIQPTAGRCPSSCQELGAPAAAGARPAGLNACLLVVAGTGSKTAKQAVTQFWQQVNAEIAKSLVQQLSGDGVAARLEVLPGDAATDSIPGLIAVALGRERCKQLMQFTHQLGGGSGPEAFFAFDAAVFSVQETDGGFKLGDGAFRKNYRYPLNNESLRTLSMSELASRLKGELAAAGILQRAPAK